MFDDIGKSAAGKDPRELFIMGDQWYTNIRTWELTISPNTLTVTPAGTAWGCIIAFNGLTLFLLACSLYLINTYADADRKAIGIFSAISILLATGACVTALTLRKFWIEQSLGPWLIVDRKLRTVSLPRHGIVVPIEQVDHLQAVSGTEYELSRWSETEYKSELNIVLVDGQERKRHHLLAYLGQHEFDGLAAEIAQLNVLPVKRIRSNWDPRRISEKWLTPESKGR
ncbi:hypothetical protein DTL42_09695 [Bremerella cremea]|uniref:Uncharacterized protein n=1 Tax=Bremerella cremea TaxID=1031537 RepID=A0A368KSJ2_9BACT|nr:hypothetical protein [Bremerella cremea]RCS51933.1 hypothetical protein DTL42_09695 [Bremerella cremea]